MLKVYLKIEGVRMPVSVLGTYVFEDERFLVIAQDVRRKKILWENILYIEEITADVVTDLPKNNLPNKRPLPPPDSAQVPSSPTSLDSDETSELTVSFTGELQRVFRIPNVSKKLASGNIWTPELAKAVFTNPQIKTILGNFIVKECQVDKSNITVVTGPSKKIQEIKNKMDVLEKFGKMSESLAPRFPKPSMKIPVDFSIKGSPFDEPISLNPSVNDTDTEEG